MVFFMVFPAGCNAKSGDTMRGRLVLSWYFFARLIEHIDDRFTRPRVWTGEQPTGCYREAWFHHHRTAAHLQNQRCFTGSMC